MFLGRLTQTPFGAVEVQRGEADLAHNKRLGQESADSGAFKFRRQTICIEMSRRHHRTVTQR